MSEMTPIQAALWGYKACRSLAAGVVRLGNFWVEFARTYDALVQAQVHIEALERENDGLVDAYNAKSQQCAELEAALAAGGEINQTTPWHLVGTPDYKWEVEVLPQITFRAANRPSWWHRLWFRILFGWHWTRILVADKEETL
jgi:hypothetical protein